MQEKVSQLRTSKDSHITSVFLSESKSKRGGATAKGTGDG
jgi:hypothetical protein